MAGLNNNKKDWLQKWRVTSGKEYSHLLLNGGRLFVPDGQHSTFLNEYANAIARGETQYVVETKTPIFRLFLDFDFKPVPSSDIMDAAVKSACTIAGYYFDTVSRAIVLKKTVSSPDKIGIHITWDSVFVDVKTAMSYRHHLVAKLEDACPDIDWKDIVDAAVYRVAAGSLRMPWSSKTNAPGVYVPVSVCDASGRIDPVGSIETAGHIREWVRCTCIRTPGESPTKTCIVTSDDYDSVTTTSTSSSQTKTVNVAEFATVLDAFQKTMPDVYRDDQKFTGMHRVGDACVVLRSSSKKCGNKGYKEHHTNTVYFVLLKKGYAYQRCYCRKDVVREGGVTCTEYVGQPWGLDKDILDGFWPPVPKPTQNLMALLDKTRPPLKKKKVRKT
jgi:hypothetical protein